MRCYGTLKVPSVMTHDMHDMHDRRVIDVQRKPHKAMMPFIRNAGSAGNADGALPFQSSKTS